MEEHNPYTPPQSSVEDPPEGSGPRLPWEDPANHPGFMERVFGTARLLLLDTRTAGEALGGSKRIGPAIAYYALVGLPIMWLVQILLAIFGPMGSQPAFFEMLGLPKPPEPTAQQVALQRTFTLISTFLLPLFAAIGLALSGALNHVGLWMVQGLRSGRGMEVTYRATIYAHGLFAVVGWIGNLWMLLPPYAGLALMGFAFLLWIAFWIWEGVLLARAHATETWRGVLGVFLPPLILACCCAGLVGAIALLVTAIARS